jgi:hypothetical protein
VWAYILIPCIITFALGFAFGESHAKNDEWRKRHGLD